jgi:ABC-type anion transport system duplicated permease subunit
MMTLEKRVLELSEKDRLQRVNCRKTVRLLQRAPRTVAEPVWTTSVGEPLQNSFGLYERVVGGKRKEKTETTRRTREDPIERLSLAVKHKIVALCILVSSVSLLWRQVAHALKTRLAWEKVSQISSTCGTESCSNLVGRVQ